MIDVMIDLETLGVDPGCVILSIGAVSFKTAVPTAFYQRISRLHSLEEGFVEDEDTVEWWSKQDSEVRREAYGGIHHPVEVLENFSKYLQSLGDEVRIWGNGANFDNVILAAAYKKLGLPVPWKFWNDRCYRTLKNLYPKLPVPPFYGAKHNALNDALHQADHATVILDHIERMKLNANAA